MSVKDLEQQQTEAKELIERRNAALRLAQNPDFRRLVMDEYCGTEAARLVQMSSDPAMDVNQRADALAMAQATGHFKRYMSMCIQMGAVAERDAVQLEEALVEARAEEDAQSEEEAIN